MWTRMKVRAKTIAKRVEKEGYSRADIMSIAALTICSTSFTYTIKFNKCNVSLTHRN